MTFQRCWATDEFRSSVAHDYFWSQSATDLVARVLAAEDAPLLVRRDRTKSQINLNCVSRHCNKADMKKCIH